MTDVAVAAAVLGAVLFLPGVAIGLAARPNTDRIALVAVAPAVTIGAVYAFAGFVSLVSLPVNPATTGVPAVAVLAFAAYRLRTADQGRRRNDFDGPAAAKWVSLALLVAGMAIGMWTWVDGFRGEAIIPPHQDGSHHGFFAARIADTGSIEPDQMLISDVETGSQGVKFYPVGIHVVAALVHQVTGVSVGQVLLALMFVSGSIVFPLGIFAIARRLVPENWLVAGFAALFSTSLTIFPFKPTGWGGIALIAGLALVPGVVRFCVDTILDKWSVAGGVVAALAVAGVFGSHTSEVPVVVALTSLAMMSALRMAWSRRLLLTLLARGLVVAVLAALAVLPSAVRLVGGLSERAIINDRSIEQMEIVLGNFVTFHAFVFERQGLLALLSVLGLLTVLVRRRMGWWLVGGAGLLVIYVWCSVSKADLPQLLSMPWYKQPERVLYNLALFAPLLIGHLFAEAHRWARYHLVDADRLRARLLGPLLRRRELISAAVALLIVIIVIPAVVLPARAASTRTVRLFATTLTPVDLDELAAFDYLSRVTRDDERVVVEEAADGALWMYAFEGVAPLLMVAPAGELPKVREEVGWTERLYLIDNIGLYGKDKTVDRLVEKYDVRYVYIDESGLPFETFMTVEEVAAIPGARAVFNRGDAWVFLLPPL